MEKKKLPGVAIALLVLLGLRTLGQLLVAVSAGEEGVIFFLLAAVYVAAIVGTVQRKRWAPMLVIAIGVIDAIAAITVLSGPGATGAILLDAILVTLAVYDKKYIEGKMKMKKKDA